MKARALGDRTGGSTACATGTVDARPAAAHPGHAQPGPQRGRAHPAGDGVAIGSGWSTVRCACGCATPARASTRRSAADLRPLRPRRPVGAVPTAPAWGWPSCGRSRRPRWTRRVTTAARATARRPHAWCVPPDAHPTTRWTTARRPDLDPTPPTSPTTEGPVTRDPHPDRRGRTPDRRVPGEGIAGQRIHHAHVADGRWPLRWRATTTSTCSSSTSVCPTWTARRCCAGSGDVASGCR